MCFLYIFLGEYENIITYIHIHMYNLRRVVDILLRHDQRAESVCDGVLVRTNLRAHLVRVYGRDDPDEVLEETRVIGLSNNAMH